MINPRNQENANDSRGFPTAENKPTGSRVTSPDELEKSLTGYDLNTNGPSHRSRKTPSTSSKEISAREARLINRKATTENLNKNQYEKSAHQPEQATVNNEHATINNQIKQIAKNSNSQIAETAAITANNMPNTNSPNKNS